MLSMPPISCHFTSGVSRKTSRIADGLTSFNASSKSFCVIINLSSVSGGNFSSSMFNSGNNLRRHFIAASLHRYSNQLQQNHGKLLLFYLGLRQGLVAYCGHGFGESPSVHFCLAP